LPAPVTAAILGIFVIVATALAWKKDQTPVFWWPMNRNGGCASPCCRHARADSLHRRLLLLAILSEYAAIRNHQRSVRSLRRWLRMRHLALIFIYASPQSARMDYPALSAAGLILPAACCS